ncbi:acetyl-CoA C-acetyltransferase [Enterococcus canis]|uniref:acetyl-CoA C-acetyltransferase n=1 Tax=Enterococcus canis TaxID=214095 RepID=A0A1L8RIF9_9ENTE|nr:acetyl-CoA C-acetyltransferase [Enterococcus canis]OJG19492.1 acetyl-CoA C-acetyltransferase [Enterococcus canis]
MNEVVITTALRTPIGSFGGTLKDVSAVDMGIQVLKGLLKESQLDPNEVDEVILGNVLHGGMGQNVARQVAVHAGIPVEKTALTIDMVCGSGLRAIELAIQAIMCGDAKLIIAGGTESMSQAPYVMKKHRWGSRLGHDQIIDTLLNDGLTDAFQNYHMGITAENVAKKYNISREKQDRFAFDSQMKAKTALENEVFKEEIVPVTIPQRKGDPLVMTVDEYPKADTSTEKLAKLRPAFLNDGTGTVTAGNASGINDGAAAVIVTTKENAEQLGLPILATIVSFANAGVEPELMGTGPIPATKKALEKANLSVDNLDLIEANEAFAAQAISVMQELSLPEDKVNVHGGAIALGHPIGASGARILVTLLHELKRRNGKYGLATLCIGGGQGTALIVKRAGEEK